MIVYINYSVLQTFNEGEKRILVIETNIALSSKQQSNSSLHFAPAVLSSSLVRFTKY